jgi:hypothetical protein
MKLGNPNRCSMAALFVNAQRRELSDALANIGELKGAIAEALKGIGFTDVVHTPGEVAGNRAGVRLSVSHLPIAGRSFWEVVAAAGDTGDATRGAVDQAVDKIRHLAFL